MMFYVFFFLLFVIVVAATWFCGFWSNVLTFINMLLAGIVATNLWEPLCNNGEVERPSPFTYLLDFLAIWFVFLSAFALFRMITDYISRYKVQFHIAMEMVGRTLASIAIALLFMSFTMFTLHLSPLPVAPFGQVLGMPPRAISPDSWWLAFIGYTSRGSLSEFRSGFLLPDYQNFRPIDSISTAGAVTIKSYSHSLSSGDRVEVRNVKGMASANGVHTVAVVNDDSFQLSGLPLDGSKPSGGEYAQLIQPESSRPFRSAKSFSLGYMLRRSIFSKLETPSTEPLKDEEE
jgi:hypothetical protein